MKDIAITAEHVRKTYRLGVLGSTTLKAAVQTRLAKAAGREDPNLPIGQAQPHGVVHAVDDVSFTIRKGERLGIIGKNGAGKTTLLKLISRITAPTEGFIGYNGRVASMLEVGAGFHGELTGRENIFLSGAVLGMTRAEIRERFDDIVAFSEIGRFIDTPIKRYSSGMYVRLGFAIAAYLSADIVIMDEVLAVGDLSFQEKCIRKMRSLADEEGRTILYVSHNMNTVRHLCSRCFVMEEGRLVYDGGAEEAFSYYRRKSDDTSRIDLRKEVRPGYEMDDTVHFLDAGYPGGSHIAKETLVTRIHWIFREDVDELHLRLEVRDETDQPIGAKTFYEVGGGRAGEERTADYAIDTSMLRNGTYRTVYVLFRIGDNGENLNIDVTDGLSFMVCDPARKERLTWHNDWWGNVRL